jgi:dolichyl-phosphate beta-glucosyltransferase
MKLSLIIPAYNEESKIERDILLIDGFLSLQKLSGEIIVVDDGSKDGTSKKASDLIGKILNPLIILSNERNYGKGYSIKRGILAAKSEFIAYCDAGATVPLANLLTGLNMLIADECDIAHGSRMLPNSVIKISQEKDRKISSAIIRCLTTKLLGVPNWLSDTQCGFKIYKADAAKQLFTRLNVDGFMFEVEIILRALKNGYHIKEFPVEWHCDRDSRITFLNTPWRVLYDIARIKIMKFD